MYFYVYIYILIFVDVIEEGFLIFLSISFIEVRKRGNKYWWNYMSCNEVVFVYKILYLRLELNILIMIFFYFCYMFFIFIVVF